MKNWKYIEGAKVGNIAADITTDGNTWFVTTSDGKKKEFPSEREAEAYKKAKREYESYAMNKKVGNANYKITHINDGNNYGYAVINEHGKVVGYNFSTKQEAEEYMQKLYRKETSNESLGEYMAKKPRVINEEKTGVEDFFKKLAKDVKEREEKDDADIEKAGNKVGNSSIGSLERDLVNLEKERKKIMDDKAHAIAHMEQAEISKCNQRLKENEEEKKYIIRRISEEKAKDASASQLAKELDRLEKERKDISQKVFEARKAMDYMEHSSWMRKAKEKDEEIKQLKRQIDRLKVGNAKDKNDRDMKIGDMVDVHGKKGKIQKIITAKDSRDDVIEVFFDNSGTFSPDRIDRYYANECTKIGNSKTGNEASDDKFAYVMREFDKGKLKTPDGKVVTDPAQAKAIAYSESKKTENGLARARNAMAKNKKVKNSAVREYKHSDGRVAQIDFNEDGSDADMSIYEGTKEIEQRNFSTIRDAEQYVTSHGFRRI